MSSPTNRTEERAQKALEEWKRGKTRANPRDFYPYYDANFEIWRAVEGCFPRAALPNPDTHPSVTLYQRPSIQELADAVVPGWGRDLLVQDERRTQVEALFDDIETLVEIVQLSNSERVFHPTPEFIALRDKIEARLYEIAEVSK